MKLTDYAPHPRLRNGDWMTMVAWGRPRRFPDLPAPTMRYFDVGPETRLLAHCHWQPRPWERPTLVALHGLEASSLAHYVGGLADKAFRRGLNVVRLNQRNCGGTDRLSTGLYHSGLTADVAAVLRELVTVDGLRAIAVAGYSLGGNLALKLAGELGDSSALAVRCVAGVSPTIDLQRSVAALEQPRNWIYQWNFVRHLKRRMRRKARLYPALYRLNGLRQVRSVRAFDEAFTAPHHGFRDAADYYHRASALRVIDRIRIPALIISAEDDPFVPVETFADPLLHANPHVTVIVTPHGGHCGFVAERSADPDDDGYWAERAVVDFVTQTLSTFTTEGAEIAEMRRSSTGRLMTWSAGPDRTSRLQRVEDLR